MNNPDGGFIVYDDSPNEDPGMQAFHAGLDGFTRAVIFSPKLASQIAAWVRGGDGCTRSAIERAAEAFYEDPIGITDWSRLAEVEPDLADRYRAATARALKAALDESELARVVSDAEMDWQRNYDTVLDRDRYAARAVIQHLQEGTMSDLRAVIEGYALSYRLPWYMQAAGPKDLKRAIAAHDREVAAKAWDEAIDSCTRASGFPPNPYRIERKTDE